MQNSKYALKSRYYLRCTWVPKNFPGTTWAITIQVVYLPEQVLRYYLSTPVPNSAAKNCELFIPTIKLLVYHITSKLLTTPLPAAAPLETAIHMISLLKPS
jgi:hypothetical protein